MFIAQWALPIQEGMTVIRECVEASIEYGDYDTAGICFTHYALLASHYSLRLPEAIGELEEILRRVAPLGQREPLRHAADHAIGPELVGSWFGLRSDAFIGAGMRRGDYAPLYEAARDRSAILTCTTLIAFSPLRSETGNARWKAPSAPPNMAMH